MFPLNVGLSCIFSHQSIDDIICDVATARNLDIAYLCPLLAAKQFKMVAEWASAVSHPWRARCLLQLGNIFKIQARNWWWDDIPEVSPTSTSISKAISKSISMSMSIYLSIYVSIYLSVYRSIDLSIYRSIDLSIYRSIDLSIYLSTYLPIYLSTYLPFCYLSS